MVGLGVEQQRIIPRRLAVVRQQRVSLVLTNQVLYGEAGAQEQSRGLLRRWLRSAGYPSELRCSDFSEKLEHELCKHSVRKALS